MTCPSRQELDDVQQGAPRMGSSSRVEKFSLRLDEKRKDEGRASGLALDSRLIRAGYRRSFTLPVCAGNASLSTGGYALTFTADDGNRSRQALMNARTAGRGLHRRRVAQQNGATGNDP